MKNYLTLFVVLGLTTTLCYSASKYEIKDTSFLFSIQNSIIPVKNNIDTQRQILKKIIKEEEENINKCLEKTNKKEVIYNIEKCNDLGKTNFEQEKTDTIKKYNKLLYITMSKIHIKSNNKGYNIRFMWILQKSL